VSSRVADWVPSALESICKSFMADSGGRTVRPWSAG
jgi:hypothetical protein